MSCYQVTIPSSSILTQGDTISLICPAPHILHTLVLYHRPNQLSATTSVLRNCCPYCLRTFVPFCSILVLEVPPSLLPAARPRLWDFHNCRLRLGSCSLARARIRLGYRTFPVLLLSPNFACFRAHISCHPTDCCCPSSQAEPRLLLFLS